MHVRVVPYRPEWPLLFAQEAEKIGKAFGAELLAVHHIGSTSVEGLAAKPIIDILAVVRDVNAIDAFAPAMEALGYEAMGEFGIPGRRYYRKGGENRTHQIHAFSKEDHWNIDRHLAVRDYLRVHPKEAQLYGNLKQHLAQQFPEDIERYCDGKDAFVKALEKRAYAWYFTK